MEILQHSSTLALFLRAHTKNVTGIRRDFTRRASIEYSLALLLSLIITMAQSGIASADFKYTYKGNPFSTFFPPAQGNNGAGECLLSGFFTLAKPLPANLVANSGMAIDVGCKLTGFSFTTVSTLSL